jgi:KRAB domain-containing zinc finger protein
MSIQSYNSCEFCSKAFAQNGDLNKHKRLHVGENTYVCSEAGCTEAFRLQSELRDHMKVHYCRDSLVEFEGY